jgi:hypothetical protein
MLAAGSPEADMPPKKAVRYRSCLLCAACFTILSGTLFPIISEYVQGNKGFLQLDSPQPRFS